MKYIADILLFCHMIIKLKQWLLLVMLPLCTYASLKKYRKPEQKQNLFEELNESEGFQLSFTNAYLFCLRKSLSVVKISFWL